MRGKVDTIQTTALLKSARILRRSLETWGDLWETTSVSWYENTLKEWIIIIIIIITIIIIVCGKGKKTLPCGKVILWELRKKFEFDHKNKWYMHNPEFVLENETYKILWDFEIQTDHLISAWRPDLVIVSKQRKRTCGIVHFAVPVDHRVKLKGSEKRDKCLDLARELKKNYGTWRRRWYQLWLVPWRQSPNNW